MAFWKNKSAIALMIAVTLGGLIMLLASAGIFNNWQLFFADRLYKGNNPSRQIVLVLVDQKTIDPDGLGEYNTWTRSNFAQVLRNINKYDPKVVAFDFFFRAQKDVVSDSDFNDALAETKSPVIMYPSNPQVYDSQKGYYFSPTDQKDVVILPLELFRILKNVRLSVGRVTKDADGLVRRMMPIIYDEATQKYDENIAFAVARRALGGQDLPAMPVVTPDGYGMGLNDNSEINIPLENGQMVINFAANTTSDSFDAVSFLDVYNEDYGQFQINPEEFFKDKIVLIGPYANFFNDFWVTPVSRDNWMTGIELQANALQTILDGAFLRNMSLPWQAALIFFLALASAFMFMFTRIRWSLLFLIAVPVVYTALAPFAFSRGLIFDLVHPYLTIVTVFVAIYMYRYLTEFKEKTALKSAFSRYVNPTIAHQIAENPDKVNLGGEKRTVTVLFTDIAHFTSISEALKPESLISLLNEYLETMSNIIMAEGGTVDKYEGDAIMAFFGAPLSQPDHAKRACMVALKMREGLEVLNKKWEKDGPLPGGEKKPALDFRCGISSGEVIVGNIGSSARVEYTVIGDIVNLGSRLEGANKKYSTSTMISEDTLNATSGEFVARELDTIRVVGKTQPIKVYELLNFKGRLVPEAERLLGLYNEGIALYHAKKFAEGLVKFDEILKAFPTDGPSTLYRQRCEVLRDFPPKPDWDGVFEMGSK